MTDGAFDFDFLSERSIRELLTAARYRLKTVWIEGVEVTQTIQYYQSARHLTDPADRGADNSVRLIASKPAWVRVYVRSAFLGSVPDVTATLSVARRSGGFFWSVVSTPSAQAPGSVTAQHAPDYATQRSTLGATLNFIIPADAFRGYLRLTVTVKRASGEVLDETTVPIDATLRQTLRIRAILVSYNGPATSAAPPPGGPPVPNLTLAAPTLANLQTTAGLALRAMPVQSTGNFASAGTLAWNLPLDDPRSCPGCCSTNWNALLTALGNVRTNDGNRTDVVYYGLLPTGIPLNVPGCGSGGLGSAAVGNQPTLMHEIGHGYGFQHTPCGNAGGTDPNYPTYEPYASASIGEYGLDIADGTIFTPNGTSDYMSYCGPRWMSLYQHNRLILHPRLGQEWLRDDLSWERFRRWREYLPWRDLPYPPPDPYRVDEMRLDPIIAIAGVVHFDGRVEVRSVARVAAMGAPPGSRTKLTAKLLGPEGALLATGALRRLDTHAGGCGCGGKDGDDEEERPATFAFEAYVPDVGYGAALVIDGGEQILWRRDAPKSPPRIGGLQANVAEGHLRLAWQSAIGSHEKGCPDGEVWVQWSGDEGKSWRGLATALTGSQAVVDLAGLPAGPLLVRLLLHDGFSTAVSESARIEVPRRAPLAAILHPEDDGVYAAGGTLRVWAAVTDQAGEPIDDAWCRWVLDGKEVAQGRDEWLTAPAAGRHKLTLVARAGGKEVERHVAFDCVPGPGSAPACDPTRPGPG